MATTDEVLAHRRALLISFLIGWCGWYGYFVLRETGLQDLWGAYLDLVIAALGTVGWVVFAISIFRIVNLKRRYKNDPAAIAALDDEFMRAQRAKALSVGFYCLLGFQVFLVVFGQQLDWPTGRSAHVSIFVGVLGCIAASLWYERET